MNHEKQKNIAKYVQDTNHYRDQFEPQQTNQFFLHGDAQAPPQPPARRTWSQQPQQKPQQQPAPPEMSSWSQQAQANKFDTWKSSSPSQQPKQQPGGFVLHQNGRDTQGDVQRLFPVVHVTQKTAQMPQQPDDMMAPQSISFIGEDDGNEDVDEGDHYQVSRKSDMSFRKSYNQMDDLEASLGKLNITSGSRTYRIPSPTTRNHAGLAANSFQSMDSQNDNDAENEKGFYISFDNDPQPKRPKPPLRTKRSPKKPNEEQNNSRYEPQEPVVKRASYEPQETYKPVPNERLSYDYERPRTSEGPKESKALIIGNDEQNLDPVRIQLEAPSRRDFEIFFFISDIGRRDGT